MTGAPDLAKAEVAIQGPLASCSGRASLRNSGDTSVADHQLGCLQTRRPAAPRSLGL